MTPVEVNEAVAKKLGWTAPTGKREPRYGGKGYPFSEFKWSNGGEFYDALPDFCTSIAAAWEVVELQKGKMISLTNPGFEWICRIIDAHNGDEVSDGACTAPMAICLAFLKLP